MDFHPCHVPRCKGRKPRNHPYIYLIEVIQEENNGHLNNVNQRHGEGHIVIACNLIDGALIPVRSPILTALLRLPDTSPQISKYQGKNGDIQQQHNAATNHQC